MGHETLPPRSKQTTETIKSKDFYDPDKAPKKEDIIGAVPDSEQKREAQEHHADELAADVQLFIDLNRDQLGISRFRMERDKSHILEMYTALKASGEIQSMDEYDWKAFLAGDETAEVMARQEKTETERENTEAARDGTEAKINTNEQKGKIEDIETEHAIDSYLGFIEAQKAQGLSSRAIINQLLDPNVAKGFDIPPEYVSELVQFRDMLSLDLGNDAPQIENFVAVAMAEQKSFQAVAESIFSSDTVSETAKHVIAEKFRVPYITTKTDFRKASLGLQAHMDDLTTTGEKLQEAARELETDLDGVKEEIAALEAKQHAGIGLNEVETQHLQSLKEQQKNLSAQVKENKARQTENADDLAHIETDNQGHPLFQHCGFNVAVDKANNQAIFQTPYGECPVPLSWYQYSLMAGEKVTHHINGFLISTAFSETGLAEHLFDENSRATFLSEFMHAASLGKIGELVTPHDIDQARTLLNVFSPNSPTTSHQPEVIQQNLQDLGILDPSGQLDPAQWKKALAFIDMHKFSGQYTYQHLKDALKTA
ncbi:hypothetical protein ACQZV8_18020 [Magnetococcales bacterium HHB-1]